MDGERNRQRRIIRIPEIEKRFGRCRSTIYRLISVGKFPRPVQLPGTAIKGWYEDEVDAVIDSFEPATMTPAVRRSA
jgi:prophage regulatory protein